MITCVTVETRTAEFHCQAHCPNISNMSSDYSVSSNAGCLVYHLLVYRQIGLPALCIPPFQPLETGVWYTDFFSKILFWTQYMYNVYTSGQ